MSLSITQLGKYEIRRELGKGAMGVVYEGFDPVLQRRVAIKTILPAQLVKGEAADVLARFKREAQAAGRLNHPGVVAVYDYGEELASIDQTSGIQHDGDGSVGQRVAYIAMEFVDGQELKDHFEANECFTVAESARIMGEILDALAHSHGQGVIHRDLKPANLIMLADGRVKIADFGIARTETSELTHAGTVLGTPAYMSPEQFMGQRVDARSDLFACGIILYQFLTGEKPFTGNPTTIMYKVLREEATPPCNLNLMLPEVWNVVLKTAIAKHPDDRFQSASDFAAAIRQALAQHGPGPLFADSQLGLYPSQTAALNAAAMAALLPTDAAAATAAVTRPEAAVSNAVANAVANAAAHAAMAPPEVPRSRENPITAATGLRSHRALRLGGAVLALLIVVGNVLYAEMAKRRTVLPQIQTEPPSLVTPTVNAASTEIIRPPPSPTASPAPSPLPTPVPAAPIAEREAQIALPQAVAPVAVPSAQDPPKPAKAQASKSTASAEVKRPAPTTAAKVSPPEAAARPARCALILQKAMVDEPLNSEERKFLNQSCQ